MSNYEVHSMAALTIELKRACLSSCLTSTQNALAVSEQWLAVFACHNIFPDYTKYDNLTLLSPSFAMISLWLSKVVEKNDVWQLSKRFFTPPTSPQDEMTLFQNFVLFSPSSLFIVNIVMFRPVRNRRMQDMQMRGFANFVGISCAGGAHSY